MRAVLRGPTPGDAACTIRRVPDAAASRSRQVARREAHDSRAAIRRRCPHVVRFHGLPDEAEELNGTTGTVPSNLDLADVQECVVTTETGSGTFETKYLQVAYAEALSTCPQQR